MTSATAPRIAVPARTVHRFVEVDGVEVFYRESLPDHPDAPVVLLLHGFPSASHQFRRLMDALGRTHRLIAPDYPGFGHTRTPDGYGYSFERLADTLEGFVEALGLTRFAMYLFDFGAPVDFRLALRRPERIAGLIVQNGNAYAEGLSDAAREFTALTPDTPGADEAVLGLFTLEATRAQYEGGTERPELVAPEGWVLDQHFLDLPGRKEAQRALAYDYKSNIAAYPRWQAWLREHRPPALIVWGGRDPFFPAPGARAYLRDLPDAELHLFDTGHFALEECVPEIAPLIDGFLARVWG
ncbi:alpha/beta fold hydrolase [Streptomyces huiliensis]|uniref:alpha/beta fold hydrolase n=1 Tax=Streptomyces huiliensis TaxID=2876027 RepID=UPI001CBC2D82|nr:alpha/beta hydrolase [Streptomyces huiliensis]MBZ4318382.1 alpha/beta hydrolase [Streptomyces huiliensis]